MIRAFLAVEGSDDLRAGLGRLQQHLRRRLDADGSRHIRFTWVRPEAIHLTVKFLGDVKEEIADPLGAALNQALQNHQPITLPLARLGVYPRPEQPRVLWAGPPEAWERGEDARRLAALHQAIEDCCAAADIARDHQPWNPHLTLARIRTGERQVGRRLADSGLLGSALTLPALVVDALVMMKSELTPDGPVHTPLWTARLGAKG